MHRMIMLDFFGRRTVFVVVMKLVFFFQVGMHETADTYIHTHAYTRQVRAISNTLRACSLLLCSVVKRLPMANLLS